MNTKSALRGMALGILMGLLAGCGKKEPQAEPAPGTNAAAQAAEQATVQAEADAAVVQRSVQYLQSCIARQNYRQARLTITRLEGMNLNPQQKQMVESLKARIPAGQ